MFLKDSLPISSRDSVAQTQRNSSIDGIRLVATIMVALIHITGKGFGAGLLVRHWWASNFYESISRAAVPLFFMVTGALLLPREHDVASIGKRMWRVALPLLVWAAAYLMWDLMMWKHGLPWAEWLPTILSHPTCGHLWYLYTLIPAYAFLPVISSFFRNTKPRMIWFVLAAWFVFGSLIPAINQLFHKPIVGFDRQIFYIYPGYMLLGAVLWSMKAKGSKHLALGVVAMALGIAGTALGTYFYSIGEAAPNETFYEYFSPTVVVAALGSFICISSVFEWIGASSKFLARLVSQFGKASFGIYLIHPLIIWSFEIHGYDYTFINPWLGTPLLMMGVISVSWAIIALVRCIPFVRKIAPG